MRLSLRFILPLVLVLGMIAYAVMPVVDRLTLQWFMRDIDIRARLISSTVNDPLAIALENKGGRRDAEKLLSRVVQDERIYALGLCSSAGELIFRAGNWPVGTRCSPSAGSAFSSTVQAPGGLLHLAYQPIVGEQGVTGELVILHDMSFVERRSADTKRYLFYLFVGLAAVISFITVVVAQLSWKGWVRGIRAVLKGEGLLKPMTTSTSPEIKPIVKDLRGLIQELEADRRIKDESQISWHPKALREILQRELAGDEVLIVSNREPYIHDRAPDGSISVKVPASGLVTALEPVMRACSGTWIAHGSGSADRDTVDAQDRVQVPPENPSYQIRRVWLTPEEEQGYYYGFANEGLWALCHIAHVRPTFRSQDWAHYVKINERFADAVVQESKTDNPVVLVQDYHFALVPKMIKERLPKATVITFWHIPFPNPEVFGICPWREQLIEGLLGSSILGFHTRFHCNNFLDTVDRFVESRIDRETSTVSFKGDLTAVHRYPISIEYPLKGMKHQIPVLDARARVRERNGLHPDVLMGIGVDRLDYTKGILERFMAVERLLELEPRWIGRFTFVQIAAPSRSTIEQYRHFGDEVRALAGKINRRFGKPGYQPICLKVEHHDPEQVYMYYRAADLCFVSSLHDGMNLVAKEFIATRDDERGVLLLSQFTGAARELPEALIVNPYDIDQCAAALQLALEMPLDEQKKRMRSMRGLIQEFNVYRWAGRMLLDAARLRRRSRVMGDGWERADYGSTRYGV